MDSPALAVVPPHRRESRGRGKVAEITFAGPWKQGEDSQSYERLVFTCHSMGMDNEESNRKRTPECEETVGARCLNARGACSFAIETTGTVADRCGTRCLYGIATRGTYRASVGGRGFRELLDPYSPLGRDDGPGSAENGSLHQRRSSRRGARRIAFEAFDYPVLTTGQRIGFSLHRE